MSGDRPHDPCLRCGAAASYVCGHCERVVCPDCLGAHWQQDCDCRQLGPTTQALMALGPLLQQLHAEERATGRRAGSVSCPSRNRASWRC